MSADRQADTGGKGQGELGGQVAIVTGGGRGIGRGIARALAAAGAALAVVSRSLDELVETVALIEAENGRAVALVADVADQRAVKGIVQQAERHLGPVDLLVNNAGSFRALGPAWEVDPDQWWRDVETNLRGTFLCTRAVLPGMLARRRGKIINLSGGGATEPLPYGSGYAASKAGILRFTDTLAAETAAYGIKVYAIGPGLVRTAMTESKLHSEAGRKWRPQLPAWFAGGRDVPPEHAGRLVVFLASAAGDGLSGRLVDVSEDAAELARRAAEIQRDDLYALRLRKGL